MTLRLPPDLESEIAETARSDGVAVEDLVAKALRQYLERHWQEQFESELRAFESMRESLQKDYAGRFVAVYQGRVLDSDKDKRALGKRVFAKYGRAPIYFQEVGPDPVPAVRVRTPRITK